MGKGKKVRDTADADDGAFEVLPIHPEAMQPAVRMVSGDLLIMSETVHHALKPLEHMVWNFDQVMTYLEVELAERLKHTPSDRITTPNPTVAVPTLQALRLTEKEPDLRAMYANLLATSMNKDKAQDAHPAFVQIISQMTGDEAKIFGVIAADQTVYIPEIISEIPTTPSQYDQIPRSTSYKYQYLTEKSQCDFPSFIPSYLDNLRRLGIIQHIHDDWLNFVYRHDGTADLYRRDLASFRTPEENAGLIELLKDLLADEVARHTDKDVYPSFAVYNEKVELTFLGEKFSDACVFPPTPQ
jgi:hypothetical protein